jgi:hypothetical protein
MLGRFKQLSGTAYIAANNKTFIDAHKIRHPILPQQIIANGNRHGPVTGVMEKLVGIAGIHHNVTMVTDEEPRLLRGQLVEPVAAKLRRAANQALKLGFHQ